jgi:hypothetical protein
LTEKHTAMKKYVVLYHAPAELVAQTTNSSPEEMEKGMEPWMAWAAKCGDKLLDLGNPLMGGQKLLPDGKSEISTRDVVGYSILQAENMDDAKALLEGHPHLAWDGACAIEVHEVMPLPG